MTAAGEDSDVCCGYIASLSRRQLCRSQQNCQSGLTGINFLGRTLIRDRDNSRKKRKHDARNFLADHLFDDLAVQSSWTLHGAGYCMTLPRCDRLRAAPFCACAGEVAIERGECGGHCPSEETDTMAF